MRKLLLLVLAATALGGCSAACQAEDRARFPRARCGPSGNTGLCPDPAEGRQCLSKLGAADEASTPLPDRFYGAGCSTLNTVQLSALHGGYNSATAVVGVRRGGTGVKDDALACPPMVRESWADSTTVRAPDGC